MSCNEALNGRRRPEKRHSDGGNRLSVLDAERRQRYPGFPDRGLYVLRMPVRRFGIFGAHRRLKRCELEALRHHGPVAVNPELPINLIQYRISGNLELMR